MIESVYITLIIISFIMLPASFFIRVDKTGQDVSGNSPKFLQQVVLLAISTILFAALAAASFNVEIFTCTASDCVKDSFVFEDNAYIFGFFALISGVLTLVKSFDAFFFAKGKL